MGVQLKPKVVLREKGQNEQLSANQCVATLKWKTAVDLDLHVYYRAKSESQDQRETAEKPGFFKRVFGGGNSSSSRSSDEGVVFFSDKGSKTSFPYIKLDQDSGVGDTGGDNEENVHITDINKHDHLLIVANRFGREDTFANYDGVVRVVAGDQDFEVPLTETKRGSYAIVAHIDNTGPTPKLININQVQSKKPSISSFLG